MKGRIKEIRNEASLSQEELSLISYHHGVNLRFKTVDFFQKSKRFYEKLFTYVVFCGIILINSSLIIGGTYEAFGRKNT